MKMNINHKIITACIFVILNLMPINNNSFAMLPVFDAAAFVKLAEEFQQLKQQYSLLQQTYQNAQQRLTQAKKIASDAEGHYGFGGLMNTVHDLKQNREWSPDNWKDALKGLSGGNAARYQALLNEYQHNHPSLTQQQYQQGASQVKARVYNQDIQSNRAVMVNTTYAFNNLQTHLNNIHEISGKIDQASNAKAAIDLNSRLLTEMAYIQTQELKMQILLNQQLAQSHADNIAAKTADAHFNTLPT